MSFKKDYKFGVEKEDLILDIIKQHFKDNIEKSISKVSKYDYKGEKYYYELKSRNNNYKEYPTTLIGKNKVFSDNHIFLFNFMDGLYYIEYKEDEFKKFDCKPFVRRKRYDYNDKEQLYYFIPIENLKKINFY